VSPLLSDVLTRAASYLGVTGGTPRHTGPEINRWLANVGLQPGYPWCAAFVYSMFVESSLALNLVNACPRTASALHLWSLAQPTQQTHAPAPGRVFVMDHGHGLGHCGLVELVNDDGTITTVEGDTDASGSRVGDAVGRHTWDPTDGSRGTLVGFCDFTPVVDAASSS
jgi:hypothetical protein